MVLGDPIARETEAVGEAREVERIVQRNRAGGTVGDRRKIEDGEGNHAAPKLDLQNGHGRRKRQSFFQPVSWPLRNCSASAESDG